MRIAGWLAKGLALIDIVTRWFAMIPHCFAGLMDARATWWGGAELTRDKEICADHAEH